MLKLYKCTDGFYAQVQGRLYLLKSNSDWDKLINRDDLYDYILNSVDLASPASVNVDLLQIDKPLVSQEIWAAGVTYYSSRMARIEESRKEGGGDHYSRVYSAERPEIFFKATPSRTVGHNKSFRIRKDSTWNVPEPELTVFASSSGKVVAYTIGNDISSRSIEGENPLYLPQAKTFDRCACLGPCLFITKENLPASTTIKMKINRCGKEVFTGETTLAHMKRKVEDLIECLFRETSFPEGVFLMTGTGIIPNDEFTLAKSDEVQITIESIGTLVNFVEA